MPIGFNPKTTLRRKISFVLLVVGSILLYFPLARISWPSELGYVRLWTVATLCLTSVVAALSLIKLVTRMKTKYLFITCGFFGVAVLSLLSLFIKISGSMFIWSVTRLFLSVYLLFSFTNTREEPGGEGGGRNLIIISAFISVILLIAVSIFIPGRITASMITIFVLPLKFIAAAFFAVSAFLYLKKGYWEFKYFEFWFVLSLIAAVFAQIYTALSTKDFDSIFYGGIILENLGYALAMIGLLTSSWAAFHEVEAEKTYLAGKTSGEAYLNPQTNTTDTAIPASNIQT